MSIVSRSNLTLEIQASPSPSINQRNLELLRRINPAAVFIPFNAGGNQQSANWFTFADQIQNQLKIPVVTHITGRYQTRTTIRLMIEKLINININRALILRGDDIANKQSPNVFPHASDLIAFIKAIHPEMKMWGACYPEGHYEAFDLTTDIKNLKFKINAGCIELVTQIGFDNHRLFAFIKQTRSIGITVPIRVGVLPVLNREQVSKMISLTHVAVPQSLANILKIDDQSEFARAGLKFTNQQILELKQNGVDRIHLYSLNNEDLLQKIINNQIS